MCLSRLGHENNEKDYVHKLSFFDDDDDDDDDDDLIILCFGCQSSASRVLQVPTTTNPARRHASAAISGFSSSEGKTECAPCQISEYSEGTCGTCRTCTSLVDCE